jgi:hypothetical protein
MPPAYVCWHPKLKPLCKHHFGTDTLKGTRADISYISSPGSYVTCGKTTVQKGKLLNGCYKKLSDFFEARL